MKRSNLVLALSVLSFTALGASAHAEPPQGPHRPPQEAFDACKAQKDGDACSVTFHGHTIQGTCEEFGSDGLACRPNGPPPPPPQAVEACEDAAEGDECTVTFRDREIDGTCEKMGQTLACRPEGPPPPRD